MWLASGARRLGQIDVADDGHAMRARRLHRGRQRAIAAIFSRQIHDDRTGPHGVDHRFGDESGCGLSRDERGRDDDVDFFGLPQKQRHFLGNECRTHHLAVAAGCRRRLP